jgi:serralysin
MIFYILKYCKFRNMILLPETSICPVKEDKETAMANENAKHFCKLIMPGEERSNTRAALLNQFGWPNASSISVKFVDGTPELQRRVRDAAEGWLYDNNANRPLANLSFNFVQDGDANIRIAFQQGDGSWSYIGTMCQQIPQDQPTMNFGWLTPESSDEDVRSVVLHEFGHAIGLIHEHQNPNKAIQWNESAVIADLSQPPNEWDIETIRRNVLNRQDPGAVTATPVDEDSIMMYPIPASWTNGTFSSDFNGDLSPTDKKFIGDRYPR